MAGAQLTSVAQIRASLRAALGLIEDLLELARVEAGQLEIEWRDTNVCATAREIVGEFRATAEQAGFHLELDENRSVPTIESDPNRVRQILGNLVSNAIKYSQPGGSVCVRLRGDTHQVTVDVSDTGPGIPRDQHAFLFEEFWRSDPHAAPGAGLGLAISRRVALLLGGDITVESEPGRGSVFTLRLPARTHAGAALTRAGDPTST